MPSGRLMLTASQPTCDLNPTVGRQGAFSIAAKAGVPVVPVTLVGTGRLMPNGKESRLYAGGARLVVHPRIPPSRDAGAMAAAARQVIAEALPAEQR